MTTRKKKNKSRKVPLLLVVVVLTVVVICSSSTNHVSVFGWQPTTTTSISNNNNSNNRISRITLSSSSSSSSSKVPSSSSIIDVVDNNNKNEQHHRDDVAAINGVSRRTALLVGAAALPSFMVLAVEGGGGGGGRGPSPIYAAAAAEELLEQKGSIDNFVNRDRNSNKDAIIREDYWYMMGKTPPRRLPPGALAQADDPQWNAFGSCQTQGGDGATSNSCTYVSLKQRIPTYSKYGFTIALGIKEYTQLGTVLKEAVERSSSGVPASLWNTASSYVFSPESQQQQQLPPPVVDGLVKMVLFASGMLTSPNFSGPNKRLLVARYYANETSYAVREIQKAIEQRQDPRRAYDAWLYGRDSFNSWIECVNDSITSKVGDKFEYIT